MNKNIKPMKVKNLPKEDLNKLNIAFKKEVTKPDSKYDVIKCWGNSDIGHMAEEFFKPCYLKKNPETAKILKELLGKYNNLFKIRNPKEV